jgi:hypothetical protein
MKSSKAREQFKNWSVRWKHERKQNNPDEIIKLWRDPLPGGWARDVWQGEIGYRKRSDHRGEQATEKRLFASQQKHFSTILGRLSNTA